MPNSPSDLGRQLAGAGHLKTTNERADEVRRLALQLAAAMEIFPKLGRKNQTTLAIAGDVIVEGIHNAWAEFVGQQWKEREPAPVGDRVNDPNWG